MIGQLSFVLILAAAASAASIEIYRPMRGVDPNTVSCDPDGQIFLLLPSYTDCNAFYSCSNGQEVPFVCPDGLIFDFELQGCDYEWRANCTLRTPPDEIDVEGSGDEPGFLHEDLASSLIDELANVARPVNVEQTNIQSAHDSILNCHRVETASTRVAYKNDCQRYWRCLNGVPQVGFCSDGLFFNAATQQCDFEANSKCLVQQDDELKGEFIVYNK
ncbi:peritrophin-1-like [Galleria mellonella]|uniref:Peritrophin-1-like n=1 Tax=Galleria mellonella TaxID=7137 RepID=A0A6J1WG85_GALME|nr:peritrophin-1-like [Galleria mellonella]